MNYQIFARKYRPQLLKQVVGQKVVVAALHNSLSLNRIHHSWIFSGTRGVGKTSLARLLAKCLNCLSGITANPCRICQSCKNIEKGCSLDLLEIDAASKTKVEDMRELLEGSQYSPNQSRFKIYLIDEVHMLSKHSFNALLKILEEPPEHIKFILATTNIRKIPNTILSRCFKLNLQKISFLNIKNYIEYILKKENIEFESRATELLSIASDGSLRDALNLIEQTISIDFKKVKTENVLKMIGGLNDYYSFFLTESILTRNIDNFILILNQLERKIIKWDELLISVLKVLHYIAMNQLSPTFSKKENIGKYKKNILLISKNIDTKIIQLFYKIILTGRKELQYSPTEKMGVEMIFLRLLSIDQKKYIDLFKKKQKNIFKKNDINKKQINFVELIPKKKLKLEEKIDIDNILTKELIKKKKK
ncbi:DNA polymerase III subunit gamma/tau [Buchnera aphidicola (Mindarus keteleerifoliae)]|uniref:DNA polymerase III subunit gamma/tau n=1 Tax=Buchnera aphidicola TaxID=9 RepID=UPI0031B69968